MNHMLLLNRPQKFLPDLYADTPAGMLPVADKPMVEYTLERLAESGLNEVTIARSKATFDCVKQLGDGTRWGITLNYIDTDNASELANYVESPIGNYRLIDGDIAIDTPIADMLASSSTNTDQLRDAHPSIMTTDDANIAEETIRFGAVRATLQSQKLELLGRFHGQTLAVLENRNNDLVIAGHPHDAARKIHVQQGGSASFDSIHGNNVFIGSLCDVHKSCRLQDNVVIGAGSVIDAEVSLDNTVVLPNTHVGEQLDLTNCLVSSQWVFNVVTQGLIQITDPALFRKTS